MLYEFQERMTRLAADLAANRRAGITDQNALDVQMLCIQEEAGELVKAYRRWAGKARRVGPFSAVEEETADVLITTGVFAVRCGMNADRIVEEKLRVVYARGWKEEDRDSATWA